jgi:energy-coupling factor transport system ATP-binding protein
MTGRATLCADEVAFRYPCGDAAVGPYSIDIAPGRLHLVHGPSGSGKSTLLRLLCGVIPHLYEGDLRGRVLLDDVPTTALPLGRITRRVGAVFQNPETQLLATTVGEEIAFGLRRTGLSRIEQEDRQRDVLDRFALGSFEHRDPRFLSGGEQQRVVIAALAARRPEVLLLDEPLSMLDRSATTAVRDDLDALRRDGAAVVAFEHRRDVFADSPGVDQMRLADLPVDVEVPEIAGCRGELTLEGEGLAVDLGGVPVLRGIDLRWRGGTAVAVHGPNGSGKTTLLRALCGLQAHRGRITRRVDGREVRGALGLAFQNADHQIFNESVRAELRYACGDVDEERYRSVLELLGLAACEQRPPLLLSEGEKKRLALGLLLMRPGLHGLCLDEPTLGQDEAHRERLGRTLRRLVAAGHLCIVATHDEAWARRWCDTSLRLEAGRVAGGDG